MSQAVNPAPCLLKGETPLHTACRHGLANLTAELLQQGANPNIQTAEAVLGQKDASVPPPAENVHLQTPLHMAIAYNHPDVVSVILEQKGRCLLVQTVDATVNWCVRMASKLCFDKPLRKHIFL